MSILMTSLFQIASFSPSPLENIVYKKHRFQIAPLWRAFSNGSVFGDRFRRCSVDNSRIRSKTAPFSFENRLVWTGPQSLVYFFYFFTYKEMKSQTVWKILSFAQVKQSDLRVNFVACFLECFLPVS